MKMFDRVVVACDHTPEMHKSATAIRAMLECFSLRVDFYHLIQKRQVIEFFSRPPDADYTVLITHGDAGKQITFSVVDQADGDDSKRDGWDKVSFSLTPSLIAETIRGQRGTLISTACGGGRRPLATAFLAAGYGAYVGADSDYVDCDGALLFVTSLFYYLLAEDRDGALRTYNLEEAVARAATADADFELGTQLFRCWYPSDVANADDEAMPKDHTS